MAPQRRAVSSDASQLAGPSAESASVVHADALLKTYSRCLKFNLDFTRYMHPQEAWVQILPRFLCGDFYQLPPVPAGALSVLVRLSANLGEFRSSRPEAGRGLPPDVGLFVACGILVAAHAIYVIEM